MHRYGRIDLDIGLARGVVRDHKSDLAALWLAEYGSDAPWHLEQKMRMMRDWGDAPGADQFEQAWLNVCARLGIIPSTLHDDTLSRYSEGHRAPNASVVTKNRGSREVKSLWNKLAFAAGLL